MRQNKNKAVFLSNVEEKLKKDVSGNFRNETIKKLLEESLRIRKLKEEGSSPDNYKKLEGILTALVASMEVVDARWNNFHKKK